MKARQRLARGRSVKVREVLWEEITIGDDRKYLEIASTDFDTKARRLEVQCECGAALAFIRAEAVMRRPDTCCCGGCRVPSLLVIGACPGCGCDDCRGQDACELFGEEAVVMYDGEEVRLFFEPVPAEAGA